MKKLVMIVLSLMLVFAFTACGGGGDSGDKKSEKSDPNVINTGEYTAEYKGYEIVKDSNGDDAIVVTWNFTNNGEESKSFGWAFDYTLFQDGVEPVSYTHLDVYKRQTLLEELKNYYNKKN